MYNTRYSLVVTDPTTNPALTGLTKGERTGSRICPVGMVVHGMEDKKSVLYRYMYIVCSFCIWQNESHPVS